MKFCEVGRHEVALLWKAKRTNKDTGEVIQAACCKSCMGKASIRIPINKAKKSSAKDLDFKNKLNVFFANQSLSFPKICENCGKNLDNSSVFARRSQTCHILPKNKNSGFPSVSDHPENKIFMCCFGGCYGHAKYDNSDAEVRKGMKVYDIAIERFKSLKNHLNQKELFKAYKYLGLDISELLK